MGINCDPVRTQKIPFRDPVVAWFLCALKYLADTMSLGELTQAAAACHDAETFNWLVGNYQGWRIGDLPRIALPRCCLPSMCSMQSAAGQKLLATPIGRPRTAAQ